MSNKNYRFLDVSSSSSRNGSAKHEVKSDIDRLTQEILTLGAQRKRNANEQEGVKETDDMRSSANTNFPRFSGSEFDPNLTGMPRNSSFNLGEQDLDTFSEGQTIVKWVDKRPISNR